VNNRKSRLNSTYTKKSRKYNTFSFSIGETDPNYAAVKKWLDNQAIRSASINNLIAQFIKTHGVEDVMTILPKQRIEEEKQGIEDSGQRIVDSEQRTGNSEQGTEDEDFLEELEIYKN